MRLTALFCTIASLTAFGCRGSDDDHTQIMPNRGAPPHHEPARNPAPLNTHNEKAGEERTENRDLELMARDAGK